MYYIVDRETGNRAKISFSNLLWLRVSLVISLVLYGVIIGGILVYLPISYEMVLGILFMAYFIELIGFFTCKTTPGNIILALLVLLQWKPIFKNLHDPKSQSRKDNKSNEIADVLNICNSYEYLKSTNRRFHL